MDKNKRDLTTRRGFVSVLGGSALALVGVWEGLGFLSGGSHGHGSSGDRQLTVPEFRDRLDEFVASYQQDDGSVHLPATPGDTHGDGHDGHDEQAGTTETATTHSGHESAIDVFVGAQQWFFHPSRMRLATDIPYRFNMMSFDVTHGAAINFGTGSLVQRLPPETLVRDTVTFLEPGEYTLYCSYFCGSEHNTMSASLVVEDRS